MSLRCDLSIANANDATKLAQLQLHIIGELMPAHIVNVGNHAHGKNITW
jgi:hypothetical protein